MQAQEILREVKDSGMASTSFWYIYSLVVTSLLVLLVISIIFLVKGFLAKFQEDIRVTHGQFAESIRILTNTQNDMHLMVQLHDKEFVHTNEDIRELRTDIEELKKRRK